MKKYNVNVNGTLYQVEIELVDEKEIANKASAPAAPQAAAPKAAPAAVSAGAEKISSPMPGTILSVNVSAGSAVKKGQVLMVLEAMKMENEIMSPKDGTVASVAVSKGASVNSGDLLCVID
ncbi:MAG: biotin/lipoyl-binding protein [Ruminococcaceae bacterium]|nr:biotin/lipoyl-binding protein [Oscillospiraceae bacterium]